MKYQEINIQGSASDKLKQKKAECTDNEGVIERGKDASDTKGVFTVSNGWSKSHVFLFWLSDLSPRLHNNKIKIKNPIKIAILHSQTNLRVLNPLINENPCATTRHFPIYVP